MITPDIAILEQPPPVHGPGSVSVTDSLVAHLRALPDNLDENRMIADMLELRRSKGMRPPPDGYGMELKTMDGRNHGVDGIQELLDASSYAWAKSMSPSLSRTARDVWNAVARMTLVAARCAVLAMSMDDDKEFPDASRS